MGTDDGTDMVDIDLGHMELFFHQRSQILRILQAVAMGDGDKPVVVAGTGSLEFLSREIPIYSCR